MLVLPQLRTAFMNRWLLALAWAVLFSLAGVATAWAQTPSPTPAPAPAATDKSFDANWPKGPLTDLNGNPLPQMHSIVRGPGYYVALWKIALVFILVLMWVRTTDWVSRDCVALSLNYDQWNSIVFFPFFVTFFLLLFLPWFLLGFPLLIIAYAVPLAIYIKTRNALVPDGDKVLTKDHLRYVVANFGKGFGAKMDAEKKLAHEKGPPVNFAALGGDTEQKNQANLIEARQSPAFITLKEIVADAVAKRAEKVLFDYTQESVGMKYMIDGVWLDLPARDRQSTDPVAAVMKKMANLNIADRKSKQEGAFSAEYNGTKYMCPVLSQGTPTGERVILSLVGKATKFGSLEELGMRDKMRDRLKEFLGSQSGIIIVCAMPQGGLSATMQMTLKSTDRLLRDFVAVGDKSKHEPEVENVELTPIDVSKGETPATVLPKLILRQPDVLVIRELTDPATLEILAAQCDDDHPKLSIATIRAKEAVEALLRVHALKAPVEDWAPKLLCVLNTRLIRKLCDKCKEPYEPTPELLAKLGIPAGRVQQLFRERQPLPPDSKEKRPPCPQCADIGYFGRTAVFELLEINDKIREALIKLPPGDAAKQLDLLKRIAKASGHRGLQEEGIVLLVLGITSLAELQRVLKQ
jgi:type II secretory ATPase GspE/PulE/Tfp pilus assembly ATPase PilB-like protein